LKTHSLSTRDLGMVGVVFNYTANCQFMLNTYSCISGLEIY